MAIYEPGSTSSSDTESVSTLISEFPASRTVREKCCFCTVCGVLLQQPEQTRTGGHILLREGVCSGLPQSCMVRSWVSGPPRHRGREKPQEAWRDPIFTGQV